MASKIPSYMTRVSQLSGAKALARRHPGMAKAIQPFVLAEEAALDLCGKSLEELVRLGTEGSTVCWGPQPSWDNDLSDGEIWISKANYGEWRLGISASEWGGYGLTFCFEDEWRDSKHIKTAKGLVAAVERFSRR